jgi:predicted CXXCH cytochrome family protein
MSVRRAAPLALLVLLAASPAWAENAGVSPEAPGSAARAGETQPPQLAGVLPRRCGVCHLDKAPAAGPGLIAFSPPARVGTGAGDAGMCYSCHDGVVVDHRRTLFSGRHHPASGNVSCGSCHTPHVQAPNVGLFMRYPQGSYAFCTSCHPGRRTGEPGEHPAFAAEPGRARDCGGCHAVHGARGEGLIRADTAESLCGPCHGDNPSRPGRGPGLSSHGASKGGPPCLSCHRVHRTAGRRMMLDKAALDGRLCRQCHERSVSVGKNEANHPIGAEASCLSCHRMHNAEKSAARGGLLIAAWAEVDAVCGRCHADAAGGRADGEWQHPVAVSAGGEGRPLAERLARAGAFFAPGARISCLSCHRAHGGRAGTPQLVAPREALCLYCHPSQNTLDPERAAPGSHPISVKPRRARIAGAFLEAGGQAGPGGEITCATCHRAHRGRAGTPGLVLPRERYSCLLCHEDEASIASTPHSTARSSRAANGAPTPGLCGGCHGEHGWRVSVGKAGTAGTAGNAIDRLCAACHGAGESDAPFSGATNHPLGVTMPSGRRTAGLPLFWNDGRRYRQGVVTCATCHDVHRVGTKGGLRASFGTGSRDLCVGCHAAEGAVAGTRHDLGGGAGSPCAPCHRVHDPLAAASWPAARGGRDRAAADLAGFCGSCHRPEGAGAASQVAEQWHPALGAKRVGCGGCHDPHRWNPEDPADRGASAPKDGGGNFLVRPATGLCVGCHADQAAVEGTPHDLTRPQAKGSPGSGPGHRGVCRPCHRAHGEQPVAFIPGKAVKPGAKADPGTDPCAGCHAPGKIAAAATVGEHGHPVGVSPGQDIGPELPLYSPAGRRQAGGRIACATCHDPHRWSPPGGSGAEAKAATSFLRMGADGYAPLCFPCHAEKSLVVGTDHDLRVSAPAAVNSQGLNAETSGVCGACHAVHRAPEAALLWNRERGEGRDPASRACTGCHRAGNDQGARVPPRAEAHLVNFPGRGMVSRLFTITRTVAEGQVGIPVFDDGGLSSDKGYLTCASCHDVHRWETDADSSGSGVAVEGDITNSFLRVRTTALDRTLCAECHGDSLVERYRNYHFPEGR